MDEFIKEKFPDGLDYDDAVQLCLRLFCSVDNVPEELHQECTKDNLAILFAALSDEGFINSNWSSAVLYGENHHSVTEKGHWVGIISSIFKLGNTVNDAKRKSIDMQLRM